MQSGLALPDPYPVRASAPGDSARRGIMYLRSTIDRTSTKQPTSRHIQRDVGCLATSVTAPQASVRRIRVDRSRKPASCQHFARPSFTQPSSSIHSRVFRNGGDVQLPVSSCNNRLSPHSILTSLLRTNFGFTETSNEWPVICVHRSITSRRE